MKGYKTLFVCLMLLGMAISGFSQKKYAVLITGDYAGIGIPPDKQWNLGKDQVEMEEEAFWNDTYLMWELLIEKGYEPEDIYVLFADGIDYPSTLPTTYAERYRPEDNIIVTDYSATKSNVSYVLNGLANGSDGFPKITQDDFFFCWTFDHGGHNAEQETYFNLLDGLMYDYEFAALTDNIQANRKVFWMQQCHSGGFIEELTADNSVFNSACIYGEVARKCDDLSPLMTSLTENEVLSNKTYYHGEFNFHMFSANKGKTPANSPYYGIIPLSNADANSDFIVSIEESYQWEDNLESIDITSGGHPGEEPAYSDQGNIAAHTSLEYPTLLFDQIGTNDTYRGIIGVSKDVHIQSGKTVTIKSKSDITMLNNATIYVDEGATLIIEDRVVIKGQTHNKIIVNGNIQVGDHVRFERIGTDGHFAGLELNNADQNLTLNYSTFNFANLEHHGIKLLIKNSEFKSCPTVHSYRGDVTVNYSSFNNGGIKLENPSSRTPYTARIENSTFSGNNTAKAVDVWGYPKFFIRYNTIQDYETGIHFSQCGDGNTGNQHIFDNEISGCSDYGISLYSVTASVAQNHVHSNEVGVSFNNSCIVAFFGNPNAASYDEMNYIVDNDNYEMYISEYSFPWYFRYNAIIDEDNAGGLSDVLIYYDGDGSAVGQEDATYNCWGSNFQQSYDLYPQSAFSISPTYCPGGNSGGSGSAERMYSTARTQFEQEAYAQSKASFQELIETYPETKQAESAVKELVTLEKFVSDDYAGLKSYYETNPTIQSNETLATLADKTANQCDIEAGNYNEAVTFFEETIENPANLQDSIYAIIDLGYLYVQMENSENKSNILKSSTHKPESKKEYLRKRDELLALLPGIEKDMNTSEQLIGRIIKNVPNPFSYSTAVYYNMFKEGTVEFRIYNSMGQIVSTIDQGYQNSGEYTFILEAANLPEGVYFCSMYVDGLLTNSKKVSILK